MSGSDILLRMILPVVLLAAASLASAQTDSLRWQVDSIGRLVEKIDPRIDNANHFWVADEDLPEVIRYSVMTGAPEKGQPMDLMYQINLADLDTAALGPSSLGDGYVIKLRVLNGLDLITVLEHGKPSEHTHQVDIPVLDQKRAAQLATMLGKAIPLAREVLPVHLRLPEGEMALRTVGVELPRVVRGNRQIEHALEPECQTVLRVKEKIPGKSVITHHDYHFYLADLDPEGTSLEIKGNQVDVVFPIKGGKRLVRQMMDGDFLEYENDVRIAVPDVERARLLAYTMPEAMAWCREQQRKASFPTDDKALQNLVEAKVDSVAFFTETLHQVVHWNQDAPCWMDLEVRTEKYRKTIQERFTLDLGKMDPAGLSIEANLKKMWLKWSSRNGAEVIQHIKNGHNTRMVSEIEIYFLDLGDARDVMKALQALAEGCD